MAKTRALSEFVAEANEILEALGRDLLVLDERRGTEPDLAPMTLEAGPVRMDVERHVVTVDGQEQRDRVRLATTGLGDDSAAELFEIVQPLRGVFMAFEQDQRLLAREPELLDRQQAVDKLRGDEPP